MSRKAVRNPTAVIRPMKGSESWKLRHHRLGEHGQNAARNEGQYPRDDLWREPAESQVSEPPRRSR